MASFSYWEGKEKNSVGLGQGMAKWPPPEVVGLTPLSPVHHTKWWDAENYIPVTFEGYRFAHYRFRDTYLSKD